MRSQGAVFVEEGGQLCSIQYSRGVVGGIEGGCGEVVGRL